MPGTVQAVSTKSGPTCEVKLSLLDTAGCSTCKRPADAKLSLSSVLFHLAEPETVFRTEGLLEDYPDSVAGGKLWFSGSKSLLR